MDRLRKNSTHMNKDIVIHGRITKKEFTNSKKKKKHKLSLKQLLINDKKFDLIKSKTILKAHANNYERPILTCANLQLPLPHWKNDIPYLLERENPGAKLENQYKRHLSYMRSTHPKQPTVPTSTDPTEQEINDFKRKRESRKARYRNKLLQSPDFRKLFCQHHGLEYNDLSTNNAPLPPPLLDPG